MIAINSLVALGNEQRWRCVSCDELMQKPLVEQQWDFQPISSKPPHIDERSLAAKGIIDRSTYDITGETIDDIMIECRQCRHVRRDLPINVFRTERERFLIDQAAKDWRWRTMSAAALQQLLVTTMNLSGERRKKELFDEADRIQWFGTDMVLAERIAKNHWPLDQLTREFLTDEQDGECYYCTLPVDLEGHGCDPGRATIEHLIPLSQGGAKHKRENLRSACQLCNNVRDRFPEADFRACLEEEHKKPKVRAGWHKVSKETAAKLVEIFRRKLQKP